MGILWLSSQGKEAAEQQSRATVQQCKVQSAAVHTNKIQQFKPTTANTYPPPIDNYTTVFPAKFYTHPISPNFFTFSTISRPQHYHNTTYPPIHITPTPPMSPPPHSSHDTPHVLHSGTPHSPLNHPMTHPALHDSPALNHPHTLKHRSNTAPPLHLTLGTNTQRYHTCSPS